MVKIIKHLESNQVLPRPPRKDKGWKILIPPLISLLNLQLMINALFASVIAMTLSNFFPTQFKKLSPLLLIVWWCFW